MSPPTLLSLCDNLDSHRVPLFVGWVKSFVLNKTAIRDACGNRLFPSYNPDSQRGGGHELNSSPPSPLWGRGAGGEGVMSLNFADLSSSFALRRGEPRPDSELQADAKFPQSSRHLLALRFRQRGQRRPR